LQTDGFGHANFYVLSGTYTVMVALGVNTSASAKYVIQNVYPDQTIGAVGGINGVIVIGTPIAGQALVATSATTATWLTIEGTTLNFPAIPNEFLNSYNAVTGMFSAAQPLLSGIGNPTSNVDFVFEGNTFTRMYSSSQQWNESLVNTSLATASVNQNSPAVALMGAVWGGSSSVVDTWGIFSNVGSGANPPSTLEFEHVGTSGLASVSVPNLICLGAEFLSGQLYDSTGAPGTAGQVLSTLGGAGTRWVTSSATAPTFKTNGVANTTQSTLNLVNGANVSVTSDALGNVTIAASNPSLIGNWMLGPGITDTAEVLGGTSWNAVSANLANGTFTANQVVVYQFELFESITITSATVENTNAVLGPTCSFGIYTQAGVKVVDDGSFVCYPPSTLQTNAVNSGTPVTLPPGVYYHAQAGSSTSPGLSFIPGITVTSSAANVLSSFLKNVSSRIAIAANPMAGGVLPATLGALTPFLPTSSNGDGVVSPMYE
jgi:hypothetical protein